MMEDRKWCQRVFLHAYAVSFPDVSGEKRRVGADPDDDGLDCGLKDETKQEWHCCICPLTPELRNALEGLEPKNDESKKLLETITSTGLLMPSHEIVHVMGTENRKGEIDDVFFPWSSQVNPIEVGDLAKPRDAYPQNRIGGERGVPPSAPPSASASAASPLASAASASASGAAAAAAAAPLTSSAAAASGSSSVVGGGGSVVGRGGGLDSGSAAHASPAAGLGSASARGRSGGGRFQREVVGKKNGHFSSRKHNETPPVKKKHRRHKGHSRRGESSTSERTRPRKYTSRRGGRSRSRGGKTREGTRRRRTDRSRSRARRGSVHS